MLSFLIIFFVTLFLVSFLASLALLGTDHGRLLIFLFLFTESIFRLSNLFSSTVGSAQTETVMVSLGMIGRIAIAASLTLLQVKSSELLEPQCRLIGIFSCVTFARVFLLTAPFIGTLVSNYITLRVFEMPQYYKTSLHKRFFFFEQNIGILRKNCRAKIENSVDGD